jgi:hypothetical protein
MNEEREVAATVLVQMTHCPIGDRLVFKQIFFKEQIPGAVLKIDLGGEYHVMET